jgi:hypothetical protein
MTKIEQIQEAIFYAEQRQSKITPLALAVPALSSLNIRHLMNNLGAISTRYLEHGVHKGGLFCSTIFKNDNLKSAVAIDSWESDATNEDKAEPQFRENVSISKPINTECLIIKANSFDIPPSLTNGDIDLYLFDADHSEDSQCRALTHFLPAMADEFIFCVDDWDFPEVEAGTLRGLRESGVEILFCQIFKGNDHDNDGWWNGYAVFLLKKKS